MMMGGNVPEQMMQKMAKMMGSDQEDANFFAGMDFEMIFNKILNSPMAEMLMNVSKEKRFEMIPKVITLLIQKGCSDFSEEEKKGVIDSILNAINE